jgi:hypothetical protein
MRINDPHVSDPNPKRKLNSLRRDVGGRPPGRFIDANGRILGALFPIVPYGCPPDVFAEPGESPEQRAFRRFPISSHKPG